MITTYESDLPEGIKLRVRGNEEYMMDEIYHRRVYESEFHIMTGNTVVDVGGEPRWVLCKSF